MAQKRSRRSTPRTSWDPVADWYAGWVGSEGSYHHQQLAIPALLDLLELSPGESLLDLGAGSGVLAPYVAEAGARYTGVDASPRLLRVARQQHGQHGHFIEGDATRLRHLAALRPASFDAVVFLLSIQDMQPLESVLESAAWALRGGGRVALLLTHPCFRVPRQSGWGWDEGRQLRFRRVDHYLTPLAVPMKRYGSAQQDATRSFHRPLEAYINGLAANHLLIDRMREIPAESQAVARAEQRAEREFPLFLGLRARKA